MAAGRRGGGGVVWGARRMVGFERVVKRVICSLYCVCCVNKNAFDWERESKTVLRVVIMRCTLILHSKHPEYTVLRVYTRPVRSCCRASCCTMPAYQRTQTTDTNEDGHTHPWQHPTNELAMRLACFSTGCTRLGICTVDSVKCDSENGSWSGSLGLFCDRIFLPFIAAGHKESV